VVVQTLMPRIKPRPRITSGKPSPDQVLGPLRRIRGRPFTDREIVPILSFPSTTKGGDPVSYSKRCHLAEAAR
jgi:hypothetical protein